MSHAPEHARIDAAVIGGSRGSFEALQALLHQLPASCHLSVIIVVHQYRHAANRFATSLAKHCRMPLKAVEDKDPIEPNHVYIAPANYHLLVERQRTFALSIDEPVNMARPSIDVLFESAARAFRSRLAGVLLSGASADGALGLQAIAAQGGLVACQDPELSIDPTMPRAGLAATGTDWVGSAEAIGLNLAQFQS